jgi:hypothetical protein
MAYNFIIYVGQDITFEYSTEVGPHGSEVILELMATLLNAGYQSP